MKNHTSFLPFALRITTSLLLITSPALAVEPVANSRNKAERLEWFRDLGFGMFIHWSHDSQLGSVISHSMVGASDDYLDRFVNELPKTFNPRKFHPQDWADLAKLAGMRYVVFTTKHHSGFCMYDTKTTDFGIMNTPFKQDITAAVFDAFRTRDIAAGVYFSPDDFWWLHQNKIPIQRQVDWVQPRNNPGLMKLNLAQLRELMTDYGKIDMVFFDGETDGLTDLAWDLQPETVITRGAIKTPEQHIPGTPIDEAWESCLTMGTQWQYKPTNESYMSGGDIIRKLVETRAKGGNLLLNVGPKPDGELPIEQEERLREVALWMFVNGECIYGVRPWIVTNEGDLWFTHNRKTGALYVIVSPKERWENGKWKEFTLHSVKATAKTRVSVLGQNDKALEYQPDVVPETTFEQTPGGLKIRAMRAQRLYNDRRWPNPVVIKLTHVESALVPPQVQSVRVERNPATGAVVLHGRLLSLGDVKSVDVGAEFRDITGLDIYERLEKWQPTETTIQSATGEFTVPLTGLEPGRKYELRAKVRHQLLTVFGSEIRFAP